MAKQDCKDCAAQIARLRAKPFYDTKGGDGIRELIATMHRYGHDKAEIVIDEALIRRWGSNGEDSVPSTSDLWALCKADPADFQSRAVESKSTQVNPDCPHCSGSGFEIVERGGHEGAKRCRCGGVPVADPNAVFVGQKAVA